MSRTAACALAFLLALAVGAVAGTTAGNLALYAYCNWRAPGSVTYAHGVWTEYGLSAIEEQPYFTWSGLALGVAGGIALGIWGVRRVNSKRGRRGDSPS